MKFEPFSFDVMVHSQLGDDPNVDNNLTADELKARFDSPMVAFKEWINETLIPALDGFLPESNMSAFIQDTKPGAYPCLWFRPNGSKMDFNFITADGTARNIDVSVNVSTDDIRNLAITSEKLASDSVTELKIADNAVTADKISANAVTTNKIASNAVDKSKVSFTPYCNDEQIILVSGLHYGDELPAAGIPGRLFFKKVT